MDCTLLPATGPDLGMLVVVACLVLLAGVILLVARARRRLAGAGALVAVLLALGVVLVPVGAPNAQAAVDCVVDPGPVNSLLIVQTSTMDGLAPNVAPAAIAGRVTNVSDDDTFIASITVSILAVTKAAGARAGTCDATDYVIVEPSMLVGRPLAPGASTMFSGASIGFLDKPVNQNACQGATVTLLYSTG